MTRLDAILGALADPVRRGIVERLIAEGERTVGEIAKPLDISMPAVSRHLKVLEDAGLIERRIDKQWRFIRVRPEAIETVDSWVDQQRRHWTMALDRLEGAIARNTPKRSMS